MSKNKKSIEETCCPNCGCDEYIGLDKNDYEDVNILQNCFNSIIMNRPDWKSRYKVEPRRKNK